MARSTDNRGVGALYATFSIHKTGSEYDLDESNIGDAVALSGTNEINHGTDGAQLLGRLEHVSGELATVQIRGVIRFRVAQWKVVPTIGKGVVVDGAGNTYNACQVSIKESDDPIDNGRGITLANNENITCDVLL